MGNLVYGVGVNDSNYVVQPKVNGKQVMCPFYKVWSSMLMRCYTGKYPTYEGCSVCPEWLSFMTFRVWMIEQDWKGNELDKDLLIEGNKVYSPDTCIFVSQQVNVFMIDAAIRGDLPIGVYWYKASSKYRAQCNNAGFPGDRYLGTYDTKEKASSAYLKRKYELAKLLAGQQTDSRIAEALIKRYELKEDK